MTLWGHQDQDLGRVTAQPAAARACHTPPEQKAQTAPFPAHRHQARYFLDSHGPTASSQHKGQQVYSTAV